MGGARAGPKWQGDQGRSKRGSLRSRRLEWPCAGRLAAACHIVMSRPSFAVRAAEEAFEGVRDLGGSGQVEGPSFEAASDGAADDRGGGTEFQGVGLRVEVELEPAGGLVEGDVEAR